MFHDPGNRSHPRPSVAAVVMFGAAMLLGPLAYAASPLRVYATASPVDSGGMSVSEKERLVNAVLDRWQAAAQRFGAEPVSWRDSFGLQLSMLPASTLQEVVALTPANGFTGIVDKVVQTLRARAERDAMSVKSLGQTTTDLVFIAIDPCRIVDTRNAGGPISSANPRSFIFSTTPAGDFSAQGGSATNCNLGFSGTITPLSPKAIAATVTIVAPSGSGNLVIYPAATTPGPTSALNYGPGAVLANTTVIVGAQGGAADFTVALNGPPHSADVVIDAIGYYYAPAATALDCTTAQHNVQVNHGGNFNDVGATCPTGYTISGGGCHWFNLDGTPASGNTVLVNRGTRQYDSVNQVYLNGWTCRMTNDDPAIDFNISVRAMCCRVPGR